MNRKRPFALFGLLVSCALLLGGCGTMLLFDPKGPIGEAERFVILVAIGLMLIVVLPVFVMSAWFSLRYRASNTRAVYAPRWSHSLKIDLVTWLVPVCIVIVLGYVAWTGSHRLNPFAPIASEAEPIRIDAVSMDWKWLFIYPDHGIATVNQVAFPADVPVSFRVTSDAVISSFFIPQLGSQIYGMPGRETRLHLLADEPGVYLGQNQQFTGSGYADMQFEAVAMSGEGFEAWVEKTRQSPDRLDLARFRELEEPGIGRVTYFSSVVPALFEHIIRKYNPGWARGDSGSARHETGAAEGR